MSHHFPFIKVYYTFKLLNKICNIINKNISCLYFTRFLLNKNSYSEHKTPNGILMEPLQQVSIHSQMKHTFTFDHTDHTNNIKGIAKQYI